MLMSSIEKLIEKFYSSPTRKDITMDENGLSFTYIPDFATGIKGVTVRTAPADNRIYTLDGRYVGRDESKLPKGIYIRRGQLIAL